MDGVRQGTPKSTSKIEDRYPCFELDINFLGGPSNSLNKQKIWAAHMLDYEAKQRINDGNTSYKQYHVEPINPKPTLPTPLELLERHHREYNSRKKECFKLSYMPTLEESIEWMEGTERERLFESIRWHIQQLPYSNKEIEDDDMDRYTQGQLRPRSYLLGPWHTLCLREVNFRRIPVKVSLATDRFCLARVSWLT